MALKDYHFALSSSDQLIHINDAISRVNNVNLLEEYRCINCGQPLIPRKGSKRRWHYAHKNCSNCSYETYLHKLAKRSLSEAFYNAEEFNIQFKQHYDCGTECRLGYSGGTCQCFWKDDRSCKSYNLKKYYDKCCHEQYDQGFKADLMLINSRDAERESLFIEIWVTHSCSKAKIDSLKHIVEIRIKSEQDIQNIIQASCFIENNEDDSILFNKDKPLVIFHNFKRIIHEKKCPF